MAKNNKNQSVKCSFCGKPQESVKKIIAGPGVYICDECVDICKGIVEEGFPENIEYTTEIPENIPSPQEIKNILDEYVIRSR